MRLKAFCAILLIVMYLTPSMAFEEQKLITLFGTEWPDLTTDQALAAWGLWAFGLIVGTGTSLTTHMPWNSCLQDVSEMVVDAYSIYVYIYRSAVTSEASYSVYAASYGISLVGKLSFVRCGENEVTLEEALLAGDPSLQPDAPTLEEQLDKINEQANTIPTNDDDNNATDNNTGAAEEVDPWDDPWARLIAIPQELFDSFNSPTNVVKQQSKLNAKLRQGGVSVDTGAECTGAPSDPLACLDKDGDGIIDADYVLGSLNNSLTGANDLNMIQFQNIMGTVAFVTSMIGSFFDIATINSLWIAQSYFDSGLYTGKSLLNMSFQSFKLVKLALDGTSINDYGVASISPQSPTSMRRVHN